MTPDDPVATDFIRQSMIARVATVSANGRPSITPIYFALINGHIWIGTSSWTLAARDAQADPRVSILFEQDKHPQDHRVLRVTGHAVVRTDAEAQRTYVAHVAFKYSLSPGGILNNLRYLHKGRLMRRYHAQSSHKGAPCVIEVTPEQMEFLEKLPSV